MEKHTYQHEGGGLRDLYANRFFAASMIAFFVLWGTTTVLVDVTNLQTHWAVMGGIAAATVHDRVVEWLHEYREAKKEVAAA